MAGGECKFVKNQNSTRDLKAPPAMDSAELDVRPTGNFSLKKKKKRDSRRSLQQPHCKLLATNFALAHSKLLNGRYCANP